MSITKKLKKNRENAIIKTLVKAILRLFLIPIYVSLIIKESDILYFKKLIKKMHPFDVLIVFLFSLSLLIGVIYGLWRLITSWFSLAFSIILAFNLSPLLKKIFPKFIPFSHFLSFLLIFLISIVLLSFVFKKGKEAIKILGLTFLDKLLGSIFLLFLSILFILAIIHLLDSLSLSYLIKGAKIPAILLEIESKVLK